MDKVAKYRTAVAALVEISRMSDEVDESDSPVYVANYASSVAKGALLILEEKSSI